MMPYRSVRVVLIVLFCRSLDRFIEPFRFRLDIESIGSGIFILSIVLISQGLITRP